MDDSLHRRLSELTRGRSAPPENRRRKSPAPEPLPPGQEAETEHGPYYLVESPLEEIARDVGEKAPPVPRGPWAIENSDGEVLEVKKPVFFDLETTGFSSTPLFLSATIDLEEGVGRQRFARNYAEEPAVIGDTAEEIAGADAIVSFNGKSYDMPFMKTRAAFHRMAFDCAAPHVDLLHVCRKRWKGRFPDFRLQTLEKLFGGGDRAGDIPSGEIPALYHDYVRRGFDPRMRNVFRHNMRDVVTLVRIFLLLAEESRREKR